MELEILTIIMLNAHEHGWVYDSYSFRVSLQLGSSVEHMPWSLNSQLFQPVLNPRNVISSNTGGNIGSVGLTSYRVWISNRASPYGCFQDEFWLSSKFTRCPDIRTSPRSKMKVPWMLCVIFVVDNTHLPYIQALSWSTIFAAKEVPLNSTRHQICDRELDHEERGKNKPGSCVKFLGSREEAAVAEASTRHLRDVKKSCFVAYVHRGKKVLC